MASNTPNFDRMTVIQLKAYLKDNMANVSLTGNKQKLVEKAKFHFQKSTVAAASSENQVVVNTISDELKLLEEKRKVFESNVQYQDLSMLPEGTISERFTSSEVYKYLTDWKLFVNEEEVDGGNEKQFDKGKVMYTSKMIQQVEFSEFLVPEDATKDLLLFRAHINASMVQEVQ